MDSPKFNNNEKNPFTELSELRLEMSSEGQTFDITCRLVFGKMHYEHNEREYEVGVSRAFLRLSLEGCETVLAESFGESLLGPVAEEDSLTVKTAAAIEASFATSLESNPKASASAYVEKGMVRTQQFNQNKLHLAVVNRPNNSWEIKGKTVAGMSDSIVEGTAIPNTKLCGLRRKTGGNRIAILGEVQVRKSDIKVSARGGNSISKALSEWSNKDAIVSQILKRAIQRQSTHTEAGQSNSTMVISRSECLEE